VRVVEAKEGCVAEEMHKGTVQLPEWITFKNTWGSNCAEGDGTDEKFKNGGR
jgi:hypothetical protein